MTPAEHIAEIEAQGFSIARGMIPPALRDEIIAEHQRLEAAGPPALEANEFTGYRTLRYFDLLNEGEVWQRVATLEPMLEVLRGVLGDDLLLSTMGSAVIDPGETAQAIHCDDQLYGIDRPHKPLVCNTMWALSDFTCENGATRVVPGSHLLPDYPDFDAPPARYTTVPVTMPAGSICFVLGTTYHGGGANVSDERRWALTINYCAGCMRPQENLQASVGRRAADFSPELQSLLGYRVSNLGVGHINASDPRRILTGQR